MGVFGEWGRGQNRAPEIWSSPPPIPTWDAVEAALPMVLELACSRKAPDLLVLHFDENDFTHTSVVG